MARALGLIAALATAACSSEPAACTDLAAWRIDLTQGAPVALAVASDGSVFVALGDNGDGTQLGVYTLFGGHLAHISADGELLSVVPAHEGDGHLGPAAIRLDRDDNLYVAWLDDARTTVARYSSHLERRWSTDFAGLGREVFFDVAPTGDSVVVTHDPQNRRRVYFVDSSGNTRWSVPVEAYGITRVVFGDEYLYGWVPGDDGALRYSIDARTGYILGSAAFNNPPTLLRRDGGYISQTFDMLLRADGQGNETWYRAFTGPIVSLPIASTTGDVLLPAQSAEGRLYVLRIDADTGVTRSVQPRCASTILGAGDATSYYGIGGGGDNPGSISRFPLP